jgi:ABC-type Fe3+/spermidine/putrescine transport system ATPase subunit
LRTLAGFEHISGGTIRLCGQDIADMPAHKGPVNTVFQHMTIAKDVA